MQKLYQTKNFNQNIYAIIDDLVGGGDFLYLSSNACEQKQMCKSRQTPNTFLYFLIVYLWWFISSYQTQQLLLFNQRWLMFFFFSIFSNIKNKKL